MLVGVPLRMPIVWVSFLKGTHKMVALLLVSLKKHTLTHTHKKRHPQNRQAHIKHKQIGPEKVSVLWYKVSQLKLPTCRRIFM